MNKKAILLLGISFSLIGVTNVKKVQASDCLKDNCSYWGCSDCSGDHTIDDGYYLLEVAGLAFQTGTIQISAPECKDCDGVKHNGSCVKHKVKFKTVYKRCMGYITGVAWPILDSETANAYIVNNYPNWEWKDDNECYDKFVHQTLETCS